MISRAEMTFFAFLPSMKKPRASPLNPEGESDGSELGRRQLYLIDEERLGGLDVCAKQMEAAVDNNEDGVGCQKLCQPFLALFCEG